ncbi:alpha/beta hydrolase [Streptomyces cocklensis]|uniref:Pimeloyl-ACP methyl ester carboxylesterase n=1 Tax=Actinacidiphila cocklensis TaxID=887465 RepID=A0A9W4GP61_9ACTN|nr:alpha/beta hydrolase [Actinacidiphila cocklensis]MDD1062715.1 alpha/beta hydrolase [Actinacidiphila cocklensis]CAG6392053.1 Pimeloyl-ACP methyl ester carboxylesterase [Actinacidiphila cocklensis]
MKSPLLLRHVRTPLTLMATAGVAVALLALSVPPASAGKAHGSPARKPTVVLVHGAFADSGSWDGVVKRLKRDGYPVVAAANPLRGLPGDAAYVKEIVAGIEGPVVLVGHSYGGSVISDAATGSANVKALVYVAAFLPEKGESAFDLSAKFPGSTLGGTLNAVPITLPDGSKDLDLTIDPAEFHDQFAADVPRGVTDLMAVSQRPVTNAALRDGAGEPAWKTIPSWTVVATQDRNIPAQVQRFMAERAHSHTVEVRASHAVSVSHPGEVAKVIEQAAAGSAG